MKKIPTKRYKSVWDALADSPSEAEFLKAKSRLLINLQEEIKQWDTGDSESAKRLGITIRRYQILSRARLSDFNLEDLFILAARAGLGPRLALKKKPAIGRHQSSLSRAAGK